MKLKRTGTILTVRGNNLKIYCDFLLPLKSFVSVCVYHQLATNDPIRHQCGVAKSPLPLSSMAAAKVNTFFLSLLFNCLSKNQKQQKKKPREFRARVNQFNLPS